MILNIVSTAIGIENEGMRNIASHMIRELEGKCTVRKSALGNPVECLKNSIGADAVLVFARASGKTAMLGKVMRMLCKNVYFILVQKPEQPFMEAVGNKPGRFSYFTIIPQDGETLAALGARVLPLKVGINTEKFRPAKSGNEVSDLRRKYGFEDDRPLVVHVGHLSEGRGLEEFLHLPKDKYQRLVIASGMFTGENVEKILTEDGVTVIKEYLPDVSEVYRMADVYLFPTKSAEFVISIPLSVMEALACGTPVVAFDGVAGLDMIKPTDGEALVKIFDSSQLESTVSALAENYSGNKESLLADGFGWTDAAELFLADLTNDLKK